ncbi:MAG: phosphatase [Defluviitaleaceae bacterium]|nr:phosphatase [Defluviitaleaceae bacterium]
MQYTLDIHCHTVASGHAYSTITENASHAASIGLTHVGICDHAPAMPGGAHLYHFANIWVLPQVISGVRVLKGAEVNIMDAAGNIDLGIEWLSKLDFVIASMHRGVFPPADKASHTQAMVNVMQNKNVHILGHPGDYFFDIDVEAVVKAAAATGTIIEINEKTLDPGSYRHMGGDFFAGMVELCKQHRAPVLASSDAHFSTLVGDVPRAWALLEASGIDESLVMNTSAELLMATIAKKRA